MLLPGIHLHVHARQHIQDFGGVVGEGGGNLVAQDGSIAARIALAAIPQTSTGDNFRTWAIMIETFPASSLQALLN